MVSSSSYRQSFCFLVRRGGAGADGGRRSNRRWRWSWPTATCNPIEVDRDVGLLAAVGEGMQGQAGPGRTDLHRDFARQRQYHRHRAGIERADDRGGGAARRAGEGREGGPRGVRPGQQAAGPGVYVPLSKRRSHGRWPASGNLAIMVVPLFLHRSSLSKCLICFVAAKSRAHPSGRAFGDRGLLDAHVPCSRTTTRAAPAQRQMVAQIGERRRSRCRMCSDSSRTPCAAGRLPPEILPNYVPTMIDSMITERALAYEAERLGFEVTDAQIADAIRQYVPEPVPGRQVRRQGSLRRAAEPAESDASTEFEADMRRQLLITRLRNVASKARW